MLKMIKEKCKIFNKILDSFKLTYSEDDLKKQSEELEKFLNEDTDNNKNFEETHKYFIDALKQFEYMQNKLPKDIKDYEYMKNKLSDDLKKYEKIRKSKGAKNYDELERYKEIF